MHVPEGSGVDLMTRMDDIDRDVQMLKRSVMITQEDNLEAQTRALLAIAEVLMEINTTLTYIKKNTRRYDE